MRHATTWTIVAFLTKTLQTEWQGRHQRGIRARLAFEHIQQHDGRWVIVDIMGKRNRVRSAPWQVRLAFRQQHFARRTGAFEVET